MIVASTPARRIALAIALSVLIHAALLWLPQIRLSSVVELPPLTARLEARREALPQPTATPPKQAEAAPALPKPGNSTSTAPTPEAASKVEKVETSSEPHPFPNFIHLTFTIHQGEDGLKIGDVYQQFEIHGDSYTLKAVKRSGGLAGLIDSEQATQISRGKVTKQGLQPQAFTEERISNGSKQNQQASFDWTAKKLTFAQGDATDLPDDAQDVLSFTYQLSQLSMRRETILLAVSDGVRLENFEVEIGKEEEISTPMGKLRALHLRKIHTQGEAYFEIWLGSEYRLLPVKFRQVDGSNEVSEEYVISDIRVADE